MNNPRFYDISVLCRIPTSQKSDLIVIVMRLNNKLIDYTIRKFAYDPFARKLESWNTSSHMLKSKFPFYRAAHKILPEEN